MELNVLLITQARMSSTRLPGKIFKEINGKKLLEIHIERLKQAKLVDKILIATTNNPSDNIVSDWAIKNNLLVFRGSEFDVLDRFYRAALPFLPKWIVRVTSDCPLLDPKLIDAVIELADRSEVDYASNILIEHFPDGQDVEVFTFTTLKNAWQSAKLASEREHVTPFIRNNINALGRKLFKAVNYDSPSDFSDIRMTVDEPADLELVKQLVMELGINADWKEYVDYIKKHNLNKINSSIIRNEGYLKSIKNDKDINNG
jgi:spore coat polysaccharide biosynthesis protein SpsF